MRAPASCWPKSGWKTSADELTVNLPYGRKRALEIATTLAMEPELMLLDEPTQGMGHEDVHRVAELIKRVSAGRTILMVEHNMSVVSTIADTITVLQRGAVLAEGPYAEVSQQSAGHGSLHGHDRRPAAGSALNEPLPLSKSRACTPGTASRTCCTASTWWCSRARWSRCWAATAPAAPPRCAPSWA